MGVFWFRKLCVDFQRFRVFVFCHRAYSKTQNPRKKFFLLFYNVGFFLNKFINVSFSLVMYLVTFVISVISGVSSNSVELTWPDVVACSARIVSGWMVVAWGTESYSGLAGNTYFVYLALRTSALGMVQTVTLGRRNILCCKSGMKIYLYLVLWFFIFYLVFLVFCVKFLQNRQVMVTYLGLCCWPGRRVSQSPNCWSSCNIRGKMREGGEDDDKGMVSVIEGVWSLGGREMSSPMRGEIVLKYEK